MTTVITFGSFDLFHVGHVKILQRAKKLGDRLIVGVSSDNCNKEKRKEKSIISLKNKIEIIKNLKCVDEVFIEDSMEKKLEYIKTYNANIFVIGDDWKGKFDYLKKYDVKVEYLKRTPNIDSTQIRNKLINKNNFWFVSLYKNYIHLPIDKFFTNLFFTNDILVDPNIITFCALSTIYIIYLLGNYNFVCFSFCLLHDLLDRMDGSMARVYSKKNIVRNQEFGSHFDAICDKIYVFLFYYLFALNSNFLLFKCFIHLISTIVRIYMYYSNITGKSTIHGKLGTFLENISLAFYFINEDVYKSFIFLSIIVTLQSLYEKIQKIIF